MKTFILLIVLGVLATPTIAQNNLDAIIQDYLKVKEALIKSDSKEASGHSKSLLASVEANPDSDKAIANAAKNLANAEGLEKQRASFAGLSILLWELVKREDYSNSNLYYQYCPMKKAYWLSAEAEIKNPYFGASMLQCGNLADKKIQ